MINRKTFIVLTICALLIFIVPSLFPVRLVLAQSIANVNPHQTRCRNLVGTYIAQTFLNGDFTGRRVLTLTEDGNFFVTDSNQGGTQGVPIAAQSSPNNRFTNGQGVWECTKTGDFTAKSLNFNFPDPQSTLSVKTARVDYSATFSSQTQTVQGTFEIRTFNLTENPLEDNVPVSQGESFTFTGQRVIIGD
ncbi:MAG: hypothetical protein PUP91_24045 [Rhizonema sp. PD37]|nr:hypothetical protein [Rhizonema sp. PD37]